MIEEINGLTVWRRHVRVRDGLHERSWDICARRRSHTRHHRLQIYHLSIPSIILDIQDLLGQHKGREDKHKHIPSQQPEQPSPLRTMEEA